MIMYVLIKYDKIPITWDNGTVCFLFGADLIFETLALGIVMLAIRVFLAQ